MVIILNLEITPHLVMRRPRSDGYWQCGICYGSIWHSSLKISCQDGCTYCKKCAAATFTGKIASFFPTLSVSECLDPDCQAHFSAADVHSVLTDEARIALAKNDLTVGGWDRDLEPGESYFQCPECERTWIAMGEFSACPGCAATVCRRCWHSCAGPEAHVCSGDEQSAAVRQCPRCRIAFVKEEGGCNHVICPRCHAHICYHCQQMFHGESIYRDHLGSKCPLSSMVDDREFLNAMTISAT
jgi:hypothetical protein